MEKQKSISEQIEDIKVEICDKYCHWAYVWNEEKEGIELCDSEHCRNCPLNRL